MLSRRITCSKPSRSTTGSARTNSSPRYRFGRATAYLLIVDGKAYDSKAILGVAYRLATGKPIGRHDFSGGVHGAAGVLRRLGFDVRNVRDRQPSDSAVLRPIRLSPGGPPESQASPGGAAAALAQFHRAFNLPMRQVPSADIAPALARLRVALLEEKLASSLLPLNEAI